MLLICFGFFNFYFFKVTYLIFSHYLYAAYQQYRSMEILEEEN